jgi:GMP synthase-like glutamine amidotransferase
MKLTIFETGRPPGRLAQIYPGYGEMFVSLMSGADAALTFETVALIDGAAIPDADTIEAALITGSPLGVYDHAPWMDDLRELIRTLSRRRRPMIGVCFGHQLIADALGGVVRKSEKGWGLGRHVYDIAGAEDFMAGAEAAFSLVASHQDQVISPPAGARTLAQSAHTAHAMLVYDHAPIVSVQGHPEFSAPFAASLYNLRRGAVFTDDEADRAVESLASDCDGQLVAQWFARFLQKADSTREGAS